MTVEFKIQGQSGDGGVVDANHVVSQLAQAGYNPQGMSADGMTLTLQDEQGPYEVKTTDALKNLGWNVMGATPLNADYDNVQMGWRAAVSKLPDDESRRAYVEGQMRRAGVEQPQVVGGGRDWFVFNPQTSQYIAVTNSPQWDASDAVEFGLEAPRMVASALGGGAGALAGGGAGSIPLAMAGAGAAGGAADAATRGLIAANDPMYREVAGQNMGGMAKDVAAGAGLDAATMGLFKGLGPALGAISPKLGNAAQTVMEASPLSRTAQATGSSMQAFGGGLKGLAGAVDRPIGHDLAAMAVPGAAEAQAVGYLAQAPSYLTKGAVRGMGALGESGMMRQHAPGMAERLRGLSGRLGQSDEFVTPTLSEEVQGQATKWATRMGGKPGPNMAEETLRPSDIMGNAFRELRIRGGEAVNKMRGGPGARAATDLDAYRLARQYGLDPKTSRGIGDDALEDFLGQETQAAGKWADAGRKFGRGIENLDRMGTAVQRGATAVGRGVVRGARGAGAGIHGAGTALRAGGTFTRPIESRALMRYGAEEAYGSQIEDALTRRGRRRSATMDEVLAQN